MPPPTGCIWAGKQRHAVTTRIRSGQTVNFVGIVEHSDWKIEGWKIEGQRADALADFKDWNPTITNLIKKAESLHKWALFDRAPLPHWHTGHVALLGDAAPPDASFDGTRCCSINGRCLYLGAVSSEFEL